MDRKRTIEEILEAIHTIRRRVASPGRLAPAERGLTYSQLLILGVVKANEGVGVKDIARTLGITSSAATQQIDALARKGYVVREDSLEDRRASKIRLSPATAAQVDAMKATLLQDLLSVFEALSDEELAAYRDLNKKLATKISGRQTVNEQ